MTSNYTEVIVLVEGPTEQLFVKKLLAPYLAGYAVYLTPIILSKSGEKGGDVKFARAKNDIGNHLKQQRGTWITLLIDYYGIDSDWPGYNESKKAADHRAKANIMMQATAKKVQNLFSDYRPETRFIPYVSMHELEALYFSDAACLAEKLAVQQAEIDKILEQCGEPEKINDDVETAPSKRLAKLSTRFKKTTTGIAIAEAIGIQEMRDACPLFNDWLKTLEELGQ
ncbi:DUF4276 family protein [Thioflexithrix psekupsensis]|uniref:DUF4276 family protein n=1 Tax=Thioflexithrix psekupsensis TaxID=1570016 RepID=A0A251XBL6_9GAMM|nr:DUF4276 family protein [Thioflexithrix psekupsensis]OUD15693.1 hypothetical protein TPSD3_04050 [Thioflexithrix psekupsensis]